MDRAAKRLTGGEAGMTVVEVVVAGVILVVGSLGVLSMVDAASRNTFRAEQSQLLNNVLQQEMEELRGLPYEQLGMATLPAQGAGGNNPNSRVSGTAFFTNRTGTALKPFVSGGSVAPGPEPFQVDDVSGSIYRYVVWDNCPAALCTDGEYLKRAIVVVRLAATASGGSSRRYQEIQGQLIDPDVEPAVNPGPTPGGKSVARWLLWLTDTTCLQSSRLEIEGDHAAHNTRGECSTGLKSGNAPGAPDLLWPEAPPLTLETPLYDYATDVEPLASPDTDKGLQLMVGSDCAAMPATAIATSPDSDPTRFQKLHKWVTPPVPSGATNFALTGKGTLSLWTQSIEGAVYPAQLCIWLFVRKGSVDTALIRPLKSLPYTTYTASTWPSSGWTEIAVPLDFKAPGGGAEVALPPGSRFGLALSVDDGSGSGIQVLYDEPSFDSRIQLDTTGTLPMWSAP